MQITKVGIIGVGTMGGMLALLLAEHGVLVSVLDRSEQNLQKVAGNAETAGLASRIAIHRSYETFCASLVPQKVIILSLPNGAPGTAVVKQLRCHLAKGDVVIDGSNENYNVTQTRQAMLRTLGAGYIGMGISGGFRGARNGPSLMPGGEKWAVDHVLPLLSMIAAKDEFGRSCVARVGSGGSGHFVKIVHNGIEHGIMSALTEAWEIMDKCLQMNGNEIGATFDSWAIDGELRGNFLVEISGPICRTKVDNTGFLLHAIRDAVVQDANDSEGTGTWSNIEALSAHVPSPSLTAAHYLRIASSNVHQRAAIHNTLGSPTPQQIRLAPGQRPEFLECLREAVYVTVLACFVQGLDLLDRVNKTEEWGVDIAQVIQLWKAGCIIKSDYIAALLQHTFSRGSDSHLLSKEPVATEIKQYWPSLKMVVLRGIEADAHLPCLSATFEYLKYIGSTDLPTNFTEAQLDSFGAHGYALKSEPVEHLQKGRHHSDWLGGLLPTEIGSACH